MNYNNNFYNPYNTFGMQQPSIYQTPPYIAQPQYQMPQYQAPQNNATQQPQTSSNFQPTFVNGVEGARAYILFPNQVMYLKDSDNENIIYVKKADSEGKCTLSALTFREMPLDSIGKPQERVSEQPVQSEYITKNDFKAFLSDFNDRMNNLSSLVEKSAYKPYKAYKNEHSERSDK